MIRRKLVIFTVAIITILATGISYGVSINASAEQSSLPSWIKNTAKWWAEGKVGDTDFINALQWLINQKILVVPQTSVSQSNTSTSSSTSKTWHEVVSLASSTSKKTDTFNIKGDKWRFTWSCVAGNEYDGINITLYKPGSELPVEFLLMQKCPQSDETTFVYKGPGEYYFDIMTANVNSWTIKVEEFY